ncbi:MAG: SGNH/GDSL hydrolase family protein, partial [Okeania sp. SIO1H6]|nr:SGNH/GDSL hydrolase family protein [Okeania sp. SIO1H6]
EIKTRKRLEKFTQAENILYLDLLPIFKSVSEPDSLYRDHIHLSPEGNLVISEVISKSILEQNQL